MWVLKLGGSLNGSDALIEWLRQAARLAEQGESLVLVPGGGSFADQVRVAQSRWRFDDLTAHRMALLAMEQTAAMLCALQPRLIEAETEDEIRLASAQGRVPVWRPSRMVLAEPDIAANWSVSSDSLALWLADLLGARGVTLVKSAELAPGDTEIAGLQRKGILDTSAQDYFARLDCPVWLLHRSSSGSLPEVLAGSTGPRPGPAAACRTGERGPCLPPLE